MSALDQDSIAVVACLTHRIGRVRNCRCEECRAIRRVLTTAQEAVAMKLARRRKAKESRT